MKDYVNKFLKNKRNKTIYLLRKSIYKLSYKEIGIIFGLSRQRIYKIYKQYSTLLERKI
jgi:hypothetical protein